MSNESSNAVRVHHNRYGDGTVKKVKGTSAEVTFDGNAWPHFGLPMWCSVGNLELIAEPEQESASNDTTCLRCDWEGHHSELKSGFDADGEYAGPMYCPQCGSDETGVIAE